uniref:ShKT domain-containing protein n=1 Tax=Rhabditophanes sp. KR3021 TaxID=114890 RepID=A0AC35TZ92_9BILA
MLHYILLFLFNILLISFVCTELLDDILQGESCIESGIDSTICFAQLPPGNVSYNGESALIFGDNGTWIDLASAVPNLYLNFNKCSDNTSAAQSLRNEAVTVHNSYRSKLALGDSTLPRAANLQLIKYDCELEALARMHAQQCAFQLANIGRIGQNLYRTNSSFVPEMMFRQSMDTWWSQIDLINSLTYSPSVNALNFENMGWENTNRTGCAVQNCTTFMMSVCFYTPQFDATLSNGSIFAAGPPCQVNEDCNYTSTLNLKCLPDLGLCTENVLSSVGNSTLLTTTMAPSNVTTNATLANMTTTMRPTNLTTTTGSPNNTTGLLNHTYIKANNQSFIITVGTTNVTGTFGTTSGSLLSTVVTPPTISVNPVTVINTIIPSTRYLTEVSTIPTTPLNPFLTTTRSSVVLNSTTTGTGNSTCFDLAPNCIDMIYFCDFTLYQSFLKSTCAKTCNFVC